MYWFSCHNLLLIFYIFYKVNIYIIIFALAITACTPNISHKTIYVTIVSIHSHHFLSTHLSPSMHTPYDAKCVWLFFFYIHSFTSNVSCINFHFIIYSCLSTYSIKHTSISFEYYSSFHVLNISYKTIYVSSISKHHHHHFLSTHSSPPIHTLRLMLQNVQDFFQRA